MFSIKIMLAPEAARIAYTSKKGFVAGSLTLHLISVIEPIIRQGLPR